MDDFPVMAVFDSETYLGEPVQDLLLCEPLPELRPHHLRVEFYFLPYLHLDITPISEVHDYAEPSILSLVHLSKPDYVRMSADDL